MEHKIIAGFIYVILFLGCFLAGIYIVAPTLKQITKRKVLGLIISWLGIFAVSAFLQWLIAPLFSEHPRSYSVLLYKQWPLYVMLLSGLGRQLFIRRKAI